MNKRSAMIVAAGLIVALVAGAYALALGVTGPATAASAKTGPHVRTQTHTVTVHRAAPSSGGAGAMSAPLGGRSYGSTGGSAGGGGGGGGYSTAGGSGSGGGSDGSDDDSTHSSPPPTSPPPTGSPSPCPHDDCHDD
jgi:hypothetical protein